MPTERLRSVMSWWMVREAWRKRTSGASGLCAVGFQPAATSSPAISIAASVAVDGVVVGRVDVEALGVLADPGEVGGGGGGVGHGGGVPIGPSFARVGANGYDDSSPATRQGGFAPPSAGAATLADEPQNFRTVARV